jgi:hypothetical protein
MDTTSIKELPRSKHSKESCKLEEQYKQIAYFNQKSITRESQKQTLEELVPIEYKRREAPTGQNSSKTLLSYSISLSLIED